MNLEKILQFYTEKLYKEFNLIPVLGCELEFYVISDEHQELSCYNLPNSLSLKLDNWHSEITLCNLDIIKERGSNQFEIRLSPTSNIYTLFEEIKLTKKKISEALKPYNAKALFTAKPFNHQPGNAFHIHLNFKHNYPSNNYQPIEELKFVIGGLLHTITDLMIFFAPNINSYKRYVTKSMDTPANISWGYNNRTTALRLVKDSESIPRIEHRVAGADAKPLETLTAILCGSYLGLKKRIIPMPPIYGLAFDPQYKKMAFPTNLIEAKNNFTKSQFWDMFNSFT